MLIFSAIESGGRETNVRPHFDIRLETTKTRRTTASITSKLCDERVITKVMPPHKQQISYIRHRSLCSLFSCSVNVSPLQPGLPDWQIFRHFDDFFNLNLAKCQLAVFTFKIYIYLVNINEFVLIYVTYQNWLWHYKCMYRVILRKYSSVLRPSLWKEC